MNIRGCNEHDADAVHSFVAACPPLTLHTRFTYWVTLRYWGSLCCVAEDHHEIVGYLSAIGTAEQRDLLYVWQVGTSPSRRGASLGRRMLEHLRTQADRLGYSRAQVSIERDNQASYALFSTFASAYGGSLQLVVDGDEPTYEWVLTTSQ